MITKEPKMIIPSSHTADDDPEAFDEQFDWTDIRALCVAPEPNHPLYGMSVSDYNHYIERNGQQGDQTFTQLTFRAPPFISVGVPVFARAHRLSIRKYLTTMVVIGMVTFQRDYHEQYSLITSSIDNTFNGVQSEQDLLDLIDMRKQTVNLGTAANSNKKYTPHVPEWVYAELVKMADAMNSTQSDMACIALSLALRNDFRDRRVADIYSNKVDTFIIEFERQLDKLCKQAKHLPGSV